MAPLTSCARHSDRDPLSGRRFGYEARDGFPTVHRARATPVPMPNTEVKPGFGDGTADFFRGRVARRWDLYSKRRRVFGLGAVLRLGLRPHEIGRARAMSPTLVRSLE